MTGPMQEHQNTSPRGRWIVVLLILALSLLLVRLFGLQGGGANTRVVAYVLNQLQGAAMLGFYSLLSPRRWQRWAFPSLWLAVGLLGWPR